MGGALLTYTKQGTHQHHNHGPCSRLGPCSSLMHLQPDHSSHALRFSRLVGTQAVQVTSTPALTLYKYWCLLLPLLGRGDER